VTCHDARRRIQETPLILYPDRIYRRYDGDAIANEVVLSIPMRCFYPVEFVDLIRSHGLTICGTWGGYAGEEVGAAGGELIVEFAR
jgi:hypothetical protein